MVATTSCTDWSVSTGDFGYTTLGNRSIQVAQHPMYEWKPVEDNRKSYKPKLKMENDKCLCTKLLWN